jgi:hypothetical protein
VLPYQKQIDYRIQVFLIEELIFLLRYLFFVSVLIDGVAEQLIKIVAHFEGII